MEPVPLPTNPQFIDLTGQTFFGVKVIAHAGKRGKRPGERNRQRYWWCECPCGNVWLVSGAHLKRGEARSCGCLKSQHISEKRTRHGKTKSPEHKAWVRIRERCYSKTSKDFPDYGGRGITVCDRWRGSFESFYADMGSRPSPVHSIGRIDNDGPYSPENCRWETLSEQSRNTRRNTLYTIGDESKTLAEWAESVGFSTGTKEYKLLWYRVVHKGEDISDALERPPTKRKTYTVQGITGTLYELARHFGIRPTLASSRISKGWSVDDAVTRPVK